MNQMMSTGKASGSRTLLANRGATTHIFAVANQKGGVGKTDLTVNLSCQLASLGKKTLIIDLDPQANATDYLVAPETPMGRTSADLLIDDSVTFDDVVIEGCREGLDIVPSHQDLSSSQIRLA